MKSKVLLTLLSLCVSLIVGCASVGSGVKGGADIALAHASFGDCRSEWEMFVPADDRAEVSEDVGRLDNHITSLNAVQSLSPDITLAAAASKIVDGSNIKSEIEAGFQAIEQNAVEYAKRTGQINNRLIGCANQLKAGWAAAFDSPGGAKVIEVLDALLPYAKYLPLLLENDEIGIKPRTVIV